MSDAARIVRGRPEVGLHATDAGEEQRGGAVAFEGSGLDREVAKILEVHETRRIAKILAPLALRVLRPHRSAAPRAFVLQIPRRLQPLQRRQPLPAHIQPDARGHQQLDPRARPVASS